MDCLVIFDFIHNIITNPQTICPTYWEGGGGMVDEAYYSIANLVVLRLQLPRIGIKLNVGWPVNRGGSNLPSTERKAMVWGGD